MKKQLILSTGTTYWLPYGSRKNIYNFLTEGWKVISTASCNDRIEYVIEKEVPSEELNDCCRTIIEYSKSHNLSSIKFCPVCGADLGMEDHNIRKTIYNYEHWKYSITHIDLPVVKYE